MERSGAKIAANSQTEIRTDGVVCLMVLNEGAPQKKSAEAHTTANFINKLKKKLKDGECHHARFHALIGSFDVVVESN